jgi:hypothetical protein
VGESLVAETLGHPRFIYSRVLGKLGFQMSKDLDIAAYHVQWFAQLQFFRISFTKYYTINAKQQVH